MWRRPLTPTLYRAQVPAISTWIAHHLDKKPVPSFTWDIDDQTGDITVDVSDLQGHKIKEVRKQYTSTVRQPDPNPPHLHH